MQFFDTKLKSADGTEDNYCIAHGGKYAYHLLDFSKSTFYLIESTSRQRQKENRAQVFFSSENELRQSPKFILIDTIVILDDCSADLFSLTFIHNGGKGYFASHRLIDRIIAAGCTGIDFVQVNEEDPWGKK